MDRTISISSNHAEAREYDIRQHRSMTHEQRQAAARALRVRYYSEDRPEVRESVPHK